MDSAPTSDDEELPSSSSRIERPADIEVPEADALEQARELVPVDERQEVDRSFEVPEADALDQATDVVLDPDER